ncbi:hypothetical protein EDD85DRAFT_947447 [Armillaria nabsnona]|nr:hypothetical protein EDD85DRAFT_947447 [Armillaria nabsnona]
MVLEFSNITDEETSSPRQYPSYSTSYIVSDSEDVEYASSIRTSTRPAVNVGNLQPIITRAPARRALGSALRQPPLCPSTGRVEISEPTESIARSVGSCNCRSAGWCQLVCAGFIGGVIVVVSSRLALVFAPTWYVNHGFV